MLQQMYCVPIPPGSPPLAAAEVEELRTQLTLAWQLEPDSGQLSYRFSFSDYYQTMAFVNAVAWIAHQQDHHPQLRVSYNSCTVGYTSHAARGLTRNDFICAARIEQLTRQE